MKKFLIVFTCAALFTNMASAYCTRERVLTSSSSTIYANDNSGLNQQYISGNTYFLSGTIVGVFYNGDVRTPYYSYVGQQSYNPPILAACTPSSSINVDVECVFDASNGLIEVISNYEMQRVCDSSR